MLKCVFVKCPMALTLFLNLETIEPVVKAKLIEQTVAVQGSRACDNLEIKKAFKEEHLKIDCCNLTLDEKEKIYKTINLFEEATNIKITNLEIKITRENLRLSYLNFSSIIAGLLIGLNYYYNTDLEICRLKKIGYQISPLVPYFIVGGFKKISESKKEMDKLPKNPYTDYLLVDKNKELILPNLAEIRKYGVVNKNPKDNFPYTDYSKIVGNDYSEIKDYLKNYEEVVSSLMGNTSLYLITSQNNILLSKVRFSLKKEFPNYKIYPVSNIEGHSVLIKYS